MDFRAEVQVREGGEGYDIVGRRREDVINDVLLDHSQRDLHFHQAVS